MQIPGAKAPQAGRRANAKIPKVHLELRTDEEPGLAGGLWKHGPAMQNLDVFSNTEEKP